MRNLYVLGILGSLGTLGLVACGSEDDGADPAATGGIQAQTGGAKATGGTVASGGTTGGMKATGGTVSTGGMKSTGGGGSGGASGGKTGSGGTVGSGGTLPGGAGAGGMPGGGSGGGGTAGMGGAKGGMDGGAGKGGAGAGGGGAGGGGGMTAGGGGGGSGGAAPTFKAVATILETKCAMCHDGGDHSDLGPGADLHDRLMDPPSGSKVGGTCSDRALVVPGMPDMSLLIAKVEQPDGPRMGCGLRMPQGCVDMNAKCLSTADIATLRAWVAAGAPEE